MPLEESDYELMQRVAKSAATLGTRELHTALRFVKEALTVMRGAPTEQLRELQRVLLDNIVHVEVVKGEAQRQIKRGGRRQLKEAQITADEMRTNPDLARLVALRRALWALRRLGDSVALRLLDHDRFYVQVVGGGPLQGEAIEKIGTEAEIRRFEEEWDAGRPAILHAITTCLRLGDVSVRSSDGWLPVEVKTAPGRRGGGRQAERMRRTVEQLRSGRAVIDGVTIARFDFQTRFRHSLGSIAAALETALTEGAGTARLGDYANAIAVDVRALARLERDEATRRIEDRIRAVTLFPLNPPFVVRGWSADKQRGSQYGVPFTSYPFSADACAALSCGYLSLSVNVDFRRIAQLLESRGFEVEITLLSEPAVCFRLRRGRDTIAVPELICERILYEGLDPEAFADAIEELIAAGPPQRTPVRIVPLFAGEQDVWN